MTLPNLPQGDAAPTAFPPFPVRRGAPEEGRTLGFLQRWVGDDAHLEGCVGDVDAGFVDLGHAFLGALATLATGWGSTRTLGIAVLAVVTTSAAARGLGREWLGRLLPRLPSWNVRIGRAGPTTRFVVAVAADRAAPRGAAREVILAGHLIAGILLYGAPWASVYVFPVFPVVILVLAGLYAWAIAHGAAGNDDLPEARAVAAATQSVARARAAGREDVVGVVAGSAADGAAGVLGFLDWWAVKPKTTRVIWVDGGEGNETLPGAPIDRLRRAGWRVDRVRIPVGDTQGLGVDVVWGSGP